MRNHFPFLQPIRFQCGTGLHQIHNQPRKAHGRRQFHRTVQMHDFRLNATRGEMALGDIRVFRGDRHARPAARIIRDGVHRFGNRNPAAANAQIKRRVDFRVVKLHQHIGTTNANRRRAMRHEGRDIEGADANDIHCRIIGGEAEPTAIFIRVILGRAQPSAGQDRVKFFQDAPFGQRNHKRRFGFSRRAIQGIGDRDIHDN